MMIGNRRSVRSPGTSFQAGTGFKISAGMLAYSLATSQLVYAEGSVQAGIGQHMRDFSSTLSTDAPDEKSASLYVDILTAGEVINISLCGTSNSNNLSIEVYAPSDDVNPVFSEDLGDSNVDCNDPMTAPLTSPVRYATAETGAYRLVLENTSGSVFERYDVSVTPDLLTNPDPTLSAGRLWAYNYSFLTGSFSKADSTNADYYALVPGGRPNSDYIWMLDLNYFAGNGYNLVANSIGVDAPNSGYSTPSSRNSVTYQHPLYLGTPARAKPRPVTPPAISNVSFVDDAGIDNSISPDGTVGVQDTGNFQFTTDVEGTYRIAIDLNADQVFGNSGDKVLTGLTTVGVNQVTWDGESADGSSPPLGEYEAEVRVNTGEFHFVANDVETSGGDESGLTIRAAWPDGTLSDTRVYWDDVTLLGGSTATSNTPVGVLSSAKEGTHTWGSFSSGGFGNSRLIDTYAYGLTANASTVISVLDNDTLPDADADGVEDAVDLDDDNDGIPDVAEGAAGPVDTDSDGMADFLDPDSDNDGIPDGVEDRVSPVFSNDDADLDGVPDEIDVTSVGGADLNGNGIADQFDATDTDLDGTPDHRDLDSDADGLNDDSEAGSTPVTPADSDSDGFPDYIDQDSDQDGLTDVVEASPAPVDTDSDGAHDHLDTDSDNDGIPDSVEAGSGSTPRDTDADNTPDFRDLDSDDDSIIDSAEAGDSPATPLDTDADNLPNYIDLDSDDDTLPDSSEGALDTDADGEPDYLDLDSDNDSIADSVELDVDTDADGIPNSLDTDADGDGIADQTEGAGDFDSDGIANMLDTDSDNDGLGDQLETVTDTDSDGQPNYLDLDSDNDGLDDQAETAVDSDSDGQPDYLDLDSDNDGIADAVELRVDTDADGIPNAIDTDSDEDGLADDTEGTGDFDGDGIVDRLDTDSDNDGLGDRLETATDTDNDGQPNYLDLDSDNDGLTDTVEIAVETNGEGSRVDSDRDAIWNHLDLDSDNDGLSDNYEAGGNDIDRNGLLDVFVDANRDGLDDSVAVTPLMNGDFDGDSVPDRLDLDSDNDGLSDAFETGGAAYDSDNNGVVDSLLDENLDGLADVVVNAPVTEHDVDGDGQSNHLDLDTDNDNVFDLVEAGGIDENGDGIVDSVLDADNDGIPDSVDASITGEADEDGDGVADFADVDFVQLFNDDSDGDGIIDTFDPDMQGDGYADIPQRKADEQSFIDSLPDEDKDGEPNLTEIRNPVRTGLSGGSGCSMLNEKTQSFDPTLAMLGVVSMLSLALRRRKSKDLLK